MADPDRFIAGGLAFGRVGVFFISSPEGELIL